MRPVSEQEAPGPDPRLRRARTATLLSLATHVWTSLMGPAVGLARADSVVWIVLGALGALAFVAAQTGAVYAAVTPWLSEAARRRLLLAFGAAAVASVPLVGPLGDREWETWAWLGASIVGTAPVLLRGRAAAATALAAVAASAGIGWATGGSIADYLIVTVSAGLGVALLGGLQVWLWALVVEAQEGRAAQGQLAAAQERLRFARDVHDLLGHRLSVIALKAELAARLAPSDPGRAAQEAAEVRELAASALTELRQAVAGYREVDLGAQLDAVRRVLRSSGVRCTVSGDPDGLAPEVATQLALVLREASTNLLRHSRAGWCTIELTREGSEVRMTVTNDGADGARPDELSSGLRGLAERLSGVGGALRTRAGDGRFTVEVTVPDVT
jgi:two-component system sensor histidine kinase DesK